MSSEKIKQLLQELRKELDAADRVDDDTLAQARQLDSDLHELLERSSDTEEMGYLKDMALELESEFATKHPTAERIIRQLINTLSNIGV